MDTRIEELFPFYVLDALTEEEKDQVESYLAEHPEARTQLQELQSGASAVPDSIAPVEPPRRVKEALMARVRTDARMSGRAVAPVTSSRRASPEPVVRRGGARLADLFRVLSLGAAAVAILWAFFLNAQVGRLQNEISALKDQVAAQSQSIDDLIRTLPPGNDVITVSLKGTDAQPHAHGQLIADPNDQSAVLVISGLPPLEAGKTYQVWLIGDAPVSAGLLTVDQNGQSVLIVTSEESIGSFNSLGISIEPEGGSEQPTGEIVVLSEL